MISAGILLKNKTDKHLNVFWQYDGKPWLENNITKALINTFESLDNTGKEKFAQSFFEIPSLNGKITYKYYLQTSPGEEEIRKIPEENRCLFAFSPTGKSWGYAGIDINDEKKMEKCIRESVTLNNLDKDEDEVEKLIKNEMDEIRSIRDNKGGSIPDAWIIIVEDDNPKYCIAMENKLYDLNPYQLNNHCEKSLFMTKNKIKYAKYEDILTALSNLKGYLVDDFLRYMYFLYYWKVDNLSQLKGMDEEHIEQYAKERCKQLLSEISVKKVDRHRGWMYSFESGNNYNREIGMDYDSENHIFRVPLYFGSTQKSSRELYELLEKPGCKIGNDFIYSNSFHFQYMGTGQNVPETYYEDKNFYINTYIDFWKQNRDSLCQMDKSRRAELLEKMFNGGIIPQQEYNRLLEYSNGYDKALNVCAEFGVFLEWKYEEAQQLDEENRFSEEIKKSITEVYRQFGIEDLIKNL